MGYNITIGKPYTYIVDEETGETRTEAETVEREDAPAYGEPTDYMNERWPSYSAWADFLDFTGLSKVFFEEGTHSLKGGHPGFIEITDEIYSEIKEIYRKYKVKHPFATPTFETEKFNDMHLARFEWLMFWLNHSFKNNKKTIVSNT